MAGDESGPQYALPSGANTFTIWQPGCVECGGAIDRILYPADSIVGTWLIPTGSGGSVSGTLSFFADGSYIHGEGPNLDPNSYPGVERGTYSWNSVTGALTVNSIVTDTGGESGLSNPVGLLTATITANGDLLGGDDSRTFLLAAAPVPEPET